MKNTLAAKRVIVPKMLMLVGVVFLLIVFISLIQGVIQERSFTRANATKSVQDVVAHAQTILGPIHHRSCVETWTVELREKDKPTVNETRTRAFAQIATPQNLAVVSGVGIEQRARSLYKTNVLQAKVVLNAQFAESGFANPARTEKDSNIVCEDPLMSVSISDPRGIRSAIAKINGVGQKVEGGSGLPNQRRGMHVRVPAASIKSGESWSVEWTIETAATEHVGFVPIGEKTTVDVSSAWPHPSFIGRFAPAERVITDKGFQATWRLSSVATDAGQGVRDGKTACPADRADTEGCAESIHVAFADPINVYSLSDRATKYGLLFVVLTFVAVGMLEVMKKLRVHPIQYLLVGAAICVFFLLLISLSEHIGFAAAYACGAVVTTLLLGYYASHMLGSARLGAPFAGVIAALYGLLYVLLQLEQTALVVGAIGLFVALAVVMIVTRNVDWHALLAPPPSPSNERDEHQANAV
jgi:inner membrane protein